MIGWLKRLAVVSGAAGVALALGFVVFAVTVWRLQPAEPGPADGIVVLTGGEHRIQAGLKLFAGGKVKRILISGVNRSTTREDLRKHSDISPVLFDCCVDIGYEALDTIGNADEAKVWADTWKFQRIIVVTSQYHMPRSLIEFGRAMPGADLVPYAVLPRHGQSAAWWFSPGVARLLAGEYAKVLPAAGRWALGRLLGPVVTSTASMEVPSSLVPVPALRTGAASRISGL